MKPVALTWKQVAAWRASRHRLDRRAPSAAALLDVVAEQGGVHAQVMSSAELSVWARVEGVAAGDVATALWDDRSLVKTWAMRGTLHLLPTADYRLWQAVLNGWRFYEKPYWLRGFNLSRDELDGMLAAVPEVLDGKVLSRVELAEAIEARVGVPGLAEKLIGSWGSVLKPACYQGLLCFASSVGQNVRFARPDQWLDIGPPLGDPEAAALEITRRYLTRYGPATREDYAHWWGGTTPAQAGKLIAALGDEVAPVTVAGADDPAWLLATDVKAAAAAKPLKSVRLLPAFDQYVIAASPHADHLLAAPERARVYRPQGWLSPVLTVGGHLSGVWRHERKGGRVVVTVEPFIALPAWAKKAAADEAERLAAFLGGTLELTVVPAAP
ncbi:MAG: winged helix DNA-binding domain-containing protein [Acidimicrobiales bacterium]